MCDETGAPLRPPRPPSKGRPAPPRQVGRYLVPSPLGVGLLELFGDGDGDGSDGGGGDGGGGDGFHLLSQPAIRAQMEAEVKQIASGELDKDTVVARNLAWFRGRFDELEASLTHERVGGFSRALRPMRDQLRDWRRAGDRKSTR